MNRTQARTLLEALNSRYELLAEEPVETLERFAMLFVRDGRGTRIDLLLGETSFDAEAIARGRKVEVGLGSEIRVCTPEDLLIYKLVSTRPRDHEDAAGVVARQGETLDRAYVLKWLREFEAALDDSTLVASFEALAPKRP